MLEEQCAQLAKHYYAAHAEEMLVAAPKTRKAMLALPKKFRDQFIDAEKAHLEKIGPKGCDIYVEEQLPKGERAMGNRWVYSWKERAHSGGKYVCDARLAAKGYTMREGEDFDETNMPTMAQASYFAQQAIALRHKRLKLRIIKEG